MLNRLYIDKEKSKNLIVLFFYLIFGAASSLHYHNINHLGLSVVEENSTQDSKDIIDLCLPLHTSSIKEIFTSHFNTQLCCYSSEKVEFLEIEFSFYSNTKDQNYLRGPPQLV